MCGNCKNQGAKDCGVIVSRNFNTGLRFEKIPKNCKGYEVKKWGYSNEPKK